MPADVRRVLALAALVFVTATSAAASPGPASAVPAASTDAVVAQIGGAVHAVASDGHRTVMGIGYRVRVLDVSDPAAPRAIGTSPPLGHTVVDIALAGDHAYAAVGEAGLAIVDISDPTAPQPLAHLDTPGAARAVAVANDLAYVADLTTGLRVIDVSTPANPVEVGHAELPFAYAVDVVIRDEVAVVADFHGTLRLVDIRDPAAPVERVTVETDGQVTGIALMDDLVLATDSPERLLAVDISDPLRPQEVARYDDLSEPNALLTAGTRAYVIDDSGLVVVDLATPDAPATAARLSLDGPQGDAVALTAGTLLVAAGYAGLHTLDVSAPDTPTYIASHRNGVINPRTLTRTNDRLLLALGAGGLAIYDATDPRRTLAQGRLPGGTTVNDVDVAADGTTAFAALGDAQLGVIDIGDPTAPAMGATVRLSGQIFPVAQLVRAAADVAYVVHHGDRLSAVDVSDPDAPHVASTVTLGQITDLEVTAERVFTLSHGDRAYQLNVLDRSDPLAPVLLGTYDIQAIAGLAGRGDRLYFGCVMPRPDRAGLCALDATASGQPPVVSRLGLPGAAIEDVHVTGDRAYVTDAHRRLWVVDLADPDSPAVEGVVALLDRPRRVVGTRDVAWVTTRLDSAFGSSGQGVLALDTRTVSLPSPTPTATPRRTATPRPEATPTAEATVATTPTATPAPAYLPRVGWP